MNKKFLNVFPIGQLFGDLIRGAASADEHLQWHKHYEQYIGSRYKFHPPCPYSHLCELPGGAAYKPEVLGLESEK